MCVQHCTGVFLNHVDMTIPQVISLIPTSQTPVAVVMMYDYDERYKEKSDVIE